MPLTYTLTAQVRTTHYLSDVFHLPILTTHYPISTSTGVDMLVKGVPHEQPEVDAEIQSLLKALLLQVLWEAEAHRLNKAEPSLPVGLKRRLQKLWSDCVVSSDASAASSAASTAASFAASSAASYARVQTSVASVGVPSGGVRMVNGIRMLTLTKLWSTSGVSSDASSAASYARVPTSYARVPTSVASVGVPSGDVIETSLESSHGSPAGVDSAQVVTASSAANTTAASPPAEVSSPSAVDGGAREVSSVSSRGSQVTVSLNHSASTTSVLGPKRCQVNILRPALLDTRRGLSSTHMASAKRAVEEVDCYAHLLCTCGYSLHVLLLTNDY